MGISSFYHQYSHYTVSKTVRTSALRALAALAVLTCSSEKAEAQASGLTSLMDTRDGLVNRAYSRYSGGENFLRPVLNDNGVVMFSAQMAGESSWRQVYLTTSQPETITPFNNQTYGDWPFWSSWSYGTTNSNSLIWLNDDSGDRRIAISSISQPNSPIFLHATASSGISGRSIGGNNQGLVVYRAGGAVQIFDTSSETNVPRQVGVSGTLNALGSSNINDAGQVVFSTQSGEIYFHDWSANTTEELLPGSGVTGFVISGGGLRGTQPAINNNGQFAFVGENTTGDAGLYVMDVNTPSVEATLIDALSGEMYFSLSINDAGQIVYIDTEITSEVPDGFIDRLKLWTGTEVITLLSTGDTFNGGIVEGLDLSSYAINNLGEIVFGYRLAGTNGAYGIGYYSIPEPSTWAALSAGAAMLGVWRTRRRGRKL